MIGDVLGANLEELRNQCRLLGHSWAEVQRPHDFVVSGKFYLADRFLHLTCARCASERHDGIRSRTGEVMARRYKYADGYQYDTDEERPSGDDLRLWVLRKARMLVSS